MSFWSLSRRSVEGGMLPGGIVDRTVALTFCNTCLDRTWIDELAMKGFAPPHDRHETHEQHPGCPTICPLNLARRTWLVSWPVSRVGSGSRARAERRLEKPLRRPLRR